MSEQTYTAGQEIDIDGATIVLIHRKGFRRGAGMQWTWGIPSADVYAEVGKDTPEEAIAHATAALNSPKCRHGDPVKICQPCTYA